MTSVLDLPVEKQEELAREEGMSLEVWRKETEAFFARCAEFEAQLDANAVRYEDLTPKEREAYDRFQARVDDEVLTNAVLNKRAEEARRTP